MWAWGMRKSDEDVGCLALCLSPFRHGLLLTWSESGGQPGSPTIPLSPPPGTLNSGPEACAPSTVAR